jgi:hypothetical protein
VIFIAFEGSVDSFNDKLYELIKLSKLGTNQIKG